MIQIVNELKTYLKEVPDNTLRKHYFLFFLTFLSATFTQYGLIVEDDEIIKLLLSFSYSIPVMIILFSHEMGHYIFAKRYKVEATLPYFIPFPLNQVGTLGAYIRMKSMPPDKSSLLDIAFWGPAMSFLVSIPVTIVGLILSKNFPVTQQSEGFHFGTPLIIEFLARVFTDFSADAYLISHPLVFAGWVGFLVTAINLFPIGQLDGGHIAYVFFGKRQKSISLLFMIIIFLLSFEFLGWLFFAAMIYIMIGIEHPPLFERHREHLNKKRKKMAFLSAAMLILCFIPVPIHIDEDALTPPPNSIPERFDSGHKVMKIFHVPEDNKT